MVNKFSLIIITLIVIFSGCSNKTNYSRKPVTNIQITPSNKVVEFGNDFTISYHTKVKNGKIKHIELFIDNQLITNTNDLDFSISVDSKKFLPGNHTVKTIATKTDSVSAVNYSSFLITSDIIPTNLQYKIIKTFPHNSSYFTQGFEFYNGLLYEGTGNYGTSLIVSYNPSVGKIISSLKIKDQYFGEGITILNGKIYELTYKSRKGFVYDVNTFKKTGEFTFESKEGWGLCNDGKNLIMSDGTSKITYLDPSDFHIVKTVDVCDNKNVLNNINELEYVDGIIYANIWTTNTIIKFEASTGKVLAYMNMENLLSYIDNSSIDVLNGIAYNQKEDTFYLTGKFWPKMFCVKFY